jgi:hypothetical protein
MDGPPPPKPVNAPASVPRPAREPAPDREPTPRDRAAALQQESARRASRREIDTIRRQATPKHLADSDGWRAWVSAYYGRHAAYLSELLVLPLEVTRLFCQDHRAALLAEGVDVLARWETEGPAALVALAETTHALTATED